MRDQLVLAAVYAGHESLYQQADFPSFLFLVVPLKTPNEAFQACDEFRKLEKERLEKDEKK